MEKSLSTVMVLGLIQIIILSVFGLYFYRITHPSDQTSVPTVPIAPISEHGS